MLITGFVKRSPNCLVKTSVKRSTKLTVPNTGTTCADQPKSRCSSLHIRKTADRLQERVQQDKIPYDKWFDRGLLRLCTGNSINYSDVTAWFVETVKQYDLFPAWVYYDSYSARYFVEEMQMQGFNMVRCIQGAKTLSLPMQMLGADLQAHKVVYNNNPVLKWCLTNTGIQTDRNGYITNQKGIYEYLLDGQEKHLNIRAFSPEMARAAYERQKGICPKCGKHFEIEEMQADHITPWSKGGKTTAENCQMLCSDCNRRKSDI